MAPKSYLYISPTLIVRDYECDIQGVVNHANYLHYMEHARHQFLRIIGDSFSSKHGKGFDMFVTHAELDYHRSLRSDDTFVIGITIGRKGPLLVVDEDVIRESDGVVVCSGRVHVAGVQDGRLTRGEYFDILMDYCDKHLKPLPFPCPSH